MSRVMIMLAIIASLLIPTVEGHYLLPARWWMAGMAVAGFLHVEIYVLRPLTNREELE